MDLHDVIAIVRNAREGESSINGIFLLKEKL